MWALHSCPRVLGTLALTAPLPKGLVQVWCRFEDGGQVQSRVQVLRQVEVMRQARGQAAKSVCRAGAGSQNHRIMTLEETSKISESNLN